MRLWYVPVLGNECSDIVCTCVCVRVCIFVNTAKFVCVIAMVCSLSLFLQFFSLLSPSLHILYSEREREREREGGGEGREGGREITTYSVTSTMYTPIYSHELCVA